MNAGFNRIELASFARFGDWWVRSRQAAFPFKRSLLWLPAALVIGCGLWVLVPASEGNVAQNEPVQLELAALRSDPSAASPTVAAQTPDEAELDRMKISSQSWRRGGLGSKALVTFTLRNDNDYAVKDVEISCSFNRRDGSHLTDRRRVIPDTVNMRSRKTFPRVHIGFININANQARCSLVAARRA